MKGLSASRDRRAYAAGPSLRDKIEPLARQSLAPAEIAARIGATSDTVRGVLSRIRRNGVELPRPRSGHAFRIAMGEREFAAINREADARQVDARDLVETIVRQIARDGLFGAVLD